MVPGSTIGAIRNTVENAVHPSSGGTQGREVDVQRGILCGVWRPRLRRGISRD